MKRTMNASFVRLVGVAAVMWGCLQAEPAHAVSLWSERSELFIDHRAHRIDDLVTVLISETSSASRTATTTTGRESTIDDKVENWFSIDGLKNALNGLIHSGNDVKSQPANTANLPAAKLSAKHDFSGTGTTSRNDNFVAKLACKVVEVLPNGNLVIEGTQSVTINAEEQMIVLRGTVRPEDVTPSNTVASYNVADAKIAYNGKGPLGDKQRRGFLQWLGDKVWPF